MSEPRKPDLHRLKARTWRAEEGEVEAAKPHLPATKNMGAFLRACVRTLAADPNRLLEAIAAHWPPEPEITGRPRKETPAAD